MKRLIAWVLFVPYAAMMILGPAFWWVMLALAAMFAAGVFVGMAASG